MHDFPVEALLAKISAAKEVADFNTSNILYAIALSQIIRGQCPATIFLALGDYRHPFEEPELDDEGTFEVDEYCWLDGYYDVVFIQAGNSAGMCGIPAPLLSGEGRHSILDHPGVRCFDRGGVTFDGRAYSDGYAAFDVIEAEGLPDIRRAWAASRWVLAPELVKDLDTYLTNGGTRHVA